MGRAGEVRGHNLSIGLKVTPLEFYPRGQKAAAAAAQLRHAHLQEDWTGNVAQAQKDNIAYVVAQLTWYPPRGDKVKDEVGEERHVAASKKQK